MNQEKLVRLQVLALASFVTALESKALRGGGGTDGSPALPSNACNYTWRVRRGGPSCQDFQPPSISR